VRVKIEKGRIDDIREKKFSLAGGAPDGDSGGGFVLEKGREKRLQER